MAIKGVYKLTSILTGRFYFGRSFDVEKRIETHLRLLSRNMHPNNEMQNDYFLGSGPASGGLPFEAYIVETFDKMSEAAALEAKLITENIDNDFLYNTVIPVDDFSRLDIENSNPRDRQLVCLVTTELMDKIKKEAARRGLSVASWVRQLAIEELDRNSKTARVADSVRAE